MKIFELFNRSKKEEKEKVEAVKESPKPSELESFCGDDHEVYEALKGTLLLNILSLSSKEFSIEETLERARAKEETARTEAEKTKKEELLYNAGLEWHLAGQIALFKGDIERVKEFFGKARELRGKPYLILAIPERAVKKAQEFYKKNKEEKQKK